MDHLGIPVPRGNLNLHLHHKPTSIAKLQVVLLLDNTRKELN
jgi:hypothetical protein